MQYAPSAHWRQLVCLKQKSRSLLAVSVLQPSESQVKQAPLLPISFQLPLVWVYKNHLSIAILEAAYFCISLLHLWHLTFGAFALPQPLVCCMKIMQGKAACSLKGLEWKEPSEWPCRRTQPCWSFFLSMHRVR